MPCTKSGPDKAFAALTTFTKVARTGLPIIPNDSRSTSNIFYHLHGPASGLDGLDQPACNKSLLLVNDPGTLQDLMLTRVRLMFFGVQLWRELSQCDVRSMLTLFLASLDSSQKHPVLVLTGCNGHQPYCTLIAVTGDYLLSMCLWWAPWPLPSLSQVKT